MYDRILVAVDGSEPADAAFEHALDIAADCGATVRALYVADTNRDSVTTVGTNVRDALEAEGEDVIEGARKQAASRGVAFEDEVLQGEPGDTILEAADERDVDLVAMGTRGRGGVRRFLLGSVAEHVVRRAEVPVLTVRADEEVRVEYPYDSVLVPTDGSGHASKALEQGVDLARRHDATLHVLSVVDVMAVGVDVRADIVLDELEDRARDAVEDAGAEAGEAGVDVVTDVITGSIPREIRSYAADNEIDLLSMGTHGRRGVDRVLLGSVTERVLRTAPAPVMTVRSPDEE
ncbi:Nucleotide-binding universal stress protein, UspA family [Natronoarchaeum philippinense]|uniref:Nucleotide-binding universal stress protein, UspA family n=1 Tax=Natronoarchaeum philippinense TaxID=558529 RepID=A0A285N080_NATPI|nr:universal stress protein [Natronoarchaeum philippinense]SNZ02840.1 Nucleotide-binding universal stress protein, UspA family [Natronoarchaeum philippinense]